MPNDIDAIWNAITAPRRLVLIAGPCVIESERLCLRVASTLTKACNDCHQATNFGFNLVQRPMTNPYPNQVFASVGK